MNVFAHSHSHPPCIKRMEEYLAHLITYKKLGSDPTQAIRNNVLSILDFCRMTHQIVHRTRNHCIEVFMYSTFLWPPQNLYTLPLSPPPKPPNTAFCDLPKISIP